MKTARDEKVSGNVKVKFEGDLVHAYVFGYDDGAENYAWSYIGTMRDGAWDRFGASSSDADRATAKKLSTEGG